MKVADFGEIDFEQTIQELKGALREHTFKLRKLAAEKLTGADPTLSDRRKQ